MAVCAVCVENEARYTCPKCLCKYCSLKCFKSEKHVAMDMDATAREEKPTTSTEKEKDSDVEVVKETSDPMVQALLKDETFQSYIASPVIQFHIMTILEIINDVSLTNEYSKDGRYEIASRKLNNLREGGVEENEYVDEFVRWLLVWLQKYKEEEEAA